METVVKRLGAVLREHFGRPNADDATASMREVLAIMQEREKARAAASASFHSAHSQQPSSFTSSRSSAPPSPHAD